MTSISSVPGVGGSNSTNAASKPSAAGMDYQAFLKLLIAQLKNQDPTKPMDSTEFVAQLATFSQVEQSLAANTKLDSLLTSSALSLAEQLVGRKITSADGAVTGIVDSVRIYSDGPVATLEDGTEIPLGAGIEIQ
jgi:flagellar basal-body rod modification protein FlgD